MQFKKSALIVIGVVLTIIQNVFANYYGNQFAIDDLSSVEQISSTVHALSYRFTAQNSKTLSDIRLYAKVAGSPTYYKVSLCNDLNGYPDGIISSTDVYSGSANSGKWLIANVPDIFIVAGNVYHIMFSTTTDSVPNIVSSSNYISLRRGSPLNSLIPQNNITDIHANFLDYGITNLNNWTIRNLQPVYLLTYTDGSSDGQPYVSQTSVGSGYSIAGSTWTGTQFETENSTRAVTKIEFYLKKYGNANDSLYYELHGPDNFSLCLESGTFAASCDVATTFSWIGKNLDNKHIFFPNSKYWVMLKSPGTAASGNTYLLDILNTDSSSSYYNYASFGSTKTCFSKYVVENDAVTISEQRDVVFRFLVDTTTPAAINDFSGNEGENEGEIYLFWSSPGDDGNNNILCQGQFIIKYSADIIDDYNSAPYAISISTTVFPGGKNEYKINGLYPGGTYYYWIKTVDIAGNSSEISNKITICSKNNSPNIPENLNLNNSVSKQITICWNMNIEQDFDKYELYYSSWPELNEWNLLATTDMTSYLHYGLAAGNTYYYRIYARDKVGNYSQVSSVKNTFVSGNSPEIVKPLTVAIDLVTDNQICWMWTDEFDDETGFRILDENNQILIVLPANTTSWVETLLLLNTSYYRSLEVSNFWGSNKSSGTACYTKCKIPQNTQAISLSTSSVLVVWQNNSNPADTKYEVQCSSYADFSEVNNELIGDTTNVIFNNLYSDTPYYFRVRAVNKENFVTEYDCIVSTKTETITRGKMLSVVINEIAWMGTKANYSNEWIELYNTTDHDILLDNWQIIYSSTIAGGTTIQFILNGKISSGGYYLLEKASDTTITNISADEIYSASRNLSNSGEFVGLYDSVETLIDYVDCRKEVAVDWFAGKDNPQYQTMERVSPFLSGNDKNNWSTNLESNGAKDKEGNFIDGTPKMRNTVSNIIDDISPSTITDLTAYSGITDGEINLQWTSTGDDGCIGIIKNAVYYIRYSTNDYSENDTVAPDHERQIKIKNVIPGATEFYTVTGLNPGTTYYFKIKVQDTFGNLSEWSNNCLAAAQDLPPQIPINLCAVPGNKSVTLSWPDNGELDIEHYYIRVSTLTIPESFIVLSTGTKTVNNLINGNTYYFRVQLIDYGDQGNGLNSIALKSNLSEIISCQPRVQPPTQLQAIHKNDYIELSWAVSPSETETNFAGYNVYRTEQCGGQYLQIANSYSSTVFLDRMNILPYKEYFYVVRCTDADSIGTCFAESFDSEIVSAKPVLTLSETGTNQKLLTPYNRQIIFGDKVNHVSVYDIKGRFVWEKGRESSSELIIWNGEGNNTNFVESGIYIYRAEMEGGKKHGTIVVVK